MSTKTLTVPEIEAGTWTLDKNHTKIGFVAKHLMVSKVRGHFEDFDAKIEIAENANELPLGGIPINSPPVCVPRKVRRATTVSPSAIRSSISA